MQKQGTESNDTLFDGSHFSPVFIHASSQVVVGSLHNLEDEFQQVLDNETLCQLFLQFVKEAHCEENFVFWLEVENFRMIVSTYVNNTDPSKPSLQDALAEEALRIYLKYFKKDSPYELNINMKIRSALEIRLKDPNPFIFDEAQSAIISLMAMNTYPLFAKSEAFKNYMEEHKKKKVPMIGLRASISPSTGSTTPNDSKPKKGFSLKSALKKKELQELRKQHETETIMEDFLHNLEKKKSNPSNLDPYAPIVCHIQLATDAKRVWKVVEFEPTVTIGQALTKVVKKIVLGNSTESDTSTDAEIEQFYFCLSSNNIQRGNDSIHEVLQNDKTLFYYGIKTHDCLELRSRSTSISSGLKEVTLVDIAGREHHVYVNFSEPSLVVVQFLVSNSGVGTPVVPSSKVDLKFVNKEDLALYLKAPSQPGLQSSQNHDLFNLEFDLELPLCSQSFILSEKCILVLKKKQSKREKQSVFSKFKSNSSEKEKETTQSTPIFGWDLKILMQREWDAAARNQSRILPTMVPAFFESAIAVILSKGIETENIFLEDGNPMEVNSLKQAIENGATELESQPSNSIHNVAHVVRSFLNELPEPLFTFSFAKQFTEIKYDPFDIQAARQLFDKLAVENQALISRVILLLNFVQRHANSNHATSDKLAKIFQSSFMRYPPTMKPPENAAIHIFNVVKAMIENPQFLRSIRKGKQLKALFDYTAKRSQELSFSRDQIITVNSEDSIGWWRGTLPNGTGGLFPVNFFTLAAPVHIMFKQQDMPQSPAQNSPIHPTPVKSSLKPEWNRGQAVLVLKSMFPDLNENALDKIVNKPTSVAGLNEALDTIASYLASEGSTFAHTDLGKAELESLARRISSKFDPQFLKFLHTAIISCESQNGSDGTMSETMLLPAAPLPAEIGNTETIQEQSAQASEILSSMQHDLVVMTELIANASMEYPNFEHERMMKTVKAMSSKIDQSLALIERLAKSQINNETK
mmetsp:Transcript_3886/g.5434  ORF Transcript_3886/g.5434 Transcript_3886/m.5434 type:complete len:978 (+) Transcript_3886:56-2989(+)